MKLHVVNYSSGIGIYAPPDAWGHEEYFKLKYEDVFLIVKDYIPSWKVVLTKFGLMHMHINDIEANETFHS